MGIRKRIIIKISSLLIVLTVVAACAPEPFLKKEETYAAIEESLTHINKKVAEHYIGSGVPVGFDAVLFRIAVEQACFPNPYCKAQAVSIFDSFGVKARKVDDIFTVMLCDKELKWKIMEDFSCNNLQVEIQSWRFKDQIACEFEVDWQSILDKYCEK